MKLGNLDIIGDPAGEKLRLTLQTSSNMATLNADETERLITYLKGLRDGMGWNRKAAADRSL